MSQSDLGCNLSVWCAEQYDDGVVSLEKLILLTWSVYVNLYNVSLSGYVSHTVILCVIFQDLKTLFKSLISKLEEKDDRRTANEEDKKEDLLQKRKLLLSTAAISGRTNKPKKPTENFFKRSFICLAKSNQVRSFNVTILGKMSPLEDNPHSFTVFLSALAPTSAQNVGGVLFVLNVLHSELVAGNPLLGHVFYLV